LSYHLAGQITGSSTRAYPSGWRNDDQGR